MAAPVPLEQLAPQRSGPISWLESLIITALTVTLGWLTHPDDPLLVHAGFSWSLFGPLLLALRYGFAQGFASAVALLAVAGLLHLGHFPAYAQMPSDYLVALFAISMLGGEFRDLWGRRLDGLQRATDYRQMRLEEFTRVHHILRLSHDRLEQKMAGSDQSLRGALLAMRQRLNEMPGEQQLLDSVAEPILDLFAHYGSLHQACLCAVDENGLCLPPLARIGEMQEVSADDPLLRLLLKERHLVSLRPDLLDQDPALRESPLLAGIPLIDVHDQLHGVVLVQLMPFFALTERNLELLSVLGGHIADLITDSRALQAHQDVDRLHFNRYLQRAILDARLYQLPCSLVAFELVSASHAQAVVAMLQRSQRDLDVLRVIECNHRGHPLVMVLLPLTGVDGLEGYMERIDQQLTGSLGAAMFELGVHCHNHVLMPQQTAQRLRHFLQEECALDERDLVSA